MSMAWPASIVSGATAVLGAGDRFHIEAAVAIGRIGDPAQLPEALRAREIPSSRHPLEDIAFCGHLPASQG